MKKPFSARAFKAGFSGDNTAVNNAVFFAEEKLRTYLRTNNRMNEFADIREVLDRLAEQYNEYRLQNDPNSRLLPHQQPTRDSVLAVASTLKERLGENFGGQLARNIYAKVDEVLDGLVKEGLGRS